MFLNTWAMLVGLAAAALPVAIHWLTRPRPTRVQVSTLRFIQGAVAQRRARYRLRDLLVLLFRTAAILLLAAAIARPLLSHQQHAQSAETAEVSRIVLFDCSQSMGARDGGVVRFERGRPIVAGLMKYAAGRKCNLLLAGASPNSVFAGPTSNLNALREALADAQVRPERLQLRKALSEASRMFEAAEPGSRLELYIVSDFQRSNWGTADFSVLPESCRIELKSVASDSAPANLVLLDVSASGRVESGKEAGIEIRLGNYSDTPRNVRVEVSLGSVVLPFEGHCPPRSETTIAGRVPVETDGWHFGSARIVTADDALPADDSIPVAIQAWPKPRLAILSRDSPDRTASSAWYISRAVATTGGARYDADSVLSVDSADPDMEAMRGADIVIAAGPGRMSDDLLTVLTAMLQRGKSLLYIASDQLDANNLHDLTAALGSSVSMPVEYLPRPNSRAGVRRFLTNVERRSTPFVVFGDELASAIKSLEFVGGLISRSTGEGLADDVRATLSDESAFLCITSTGRGKLAIMNVDLERSNLARTPVMVPLLGELISQNLSVFNPEQSHFRCGESFTVRLDVGEENLEDLSVHGADGTASESEAGVFSAVPGGVVWAVSEAGGPSVYQAKLGERTVGAAVTCIPTEESDLRTLPAEVFEKRLSGGRKLRFGSGTSFNEDSQDTFWVWMAAACMLCIFAELTTLKLFRK